MRARMAIAYGEVEVMLREVLLKDKPSAMLEASPKGTVPVLVLTDGIVIDESLDVMAWALSHKDPDNWLRDAGLTDPLIRRCDDEFKYWLDRYKYAVRFPEHTEAWYRQQGEQFLKELEILLQSHRYLRGDTVSVVDIALFPFIRQFAGVDVNWWPSQPCARVSAWLQKLLDSELFSQVMAKYPLWLPDSPSEIFPPKA